MQRIILIGYMGAGKTTVGRALARALQLQFIDLDQYIENRFRRTISQLFEERGEEGFRQLEQRMLHEVGEMEDVVISAGGGTPCFFDNMAYMNRMAQTIYLQASVETLISHLQGGRQQRPLLAAKSNEELHAFITSALEQREPYYLQAQIIFNTPLLISRTAIDSCVSQLSDLIKQ